MAEFNLSEKRMEFYRELCKDYPDLKWGLIFDKIFQQDKEFIRLLKEELCFKNSVLDDEQENWVGNKIDKLVGKSLEGNNGT